LEDECHRREADKLTHLVFVGEGQTEESFARDVLATSLLDREMFVYPRLIRTSAHGRGGALSWNRVRLFLRNTLRERTDTYVTTFFDLYRLDRDFPGWQHSQAILNPLDRAAEIERQFHAAIVAEAGCREERFIPHIQPYEFEALIFTNLEVLPGVESNWNRRLEVLREARQASPSPEHINDGEMTHPSARLQTALRDPIYQKVLHGVTITSRIGLPRIREACSHFGGWLTRLENLQPLK
jgi:hypothetical protein